ncbi:MAG TPA: phosphatidylglycerophosphatase A [Syntrophorhabdales bacterium]|nr:phosphatidylglycerophosphatase A [Syntrophorhabdales bacterium]
MAHRLELIFVTCGYVGYLPYAPGTWASIVGCVLLYLLPGVLNHPVTVMLIAIAAILCINRLELAEGDPGYIVVDELAGICVTMVGQGLGFSNLLKGFILFRIFDILKPFPVRRLERLPKGYGIVADDLMAGIYANAALLLLGRLR